MPKPNGKPQPETPFTILRDRVMSLSQARNTGERMTRIKACFEAIEASERTLSEVSQSLGHLMRMTLHVTQGKYVRLPFKPPPGTKTMRVVDAKDVPVAIASPRDMVVLLEPKHEEPIAIVVTAADDTESRIVVNPRPDEKVAIAPE